MTEVVPVSVRAKPIDLRWLAVLMVLAWLAFLSYRAWTQANIDIVSRPQLLTAPIVVEGKLLIDPPRLEIHAIRFVSQRIKQQYPKPAELLRVGNIITVFMRIDPKLDRDVDYLIPLAPLGPARFEIWGAPKDGGDPGPQGEERIYSLTPAVRAQADLLLRRRGNGE